MGNQNYRIQIDVQKIVGDVPKFIGSRCLNITGQFAEMLEPLPDDRELMKEMSTVSPYARQLAEHNAMKEKQREDLIKEIANRLSEHLKIIIAEQDKINGY